MPRLTRIYTRTGDDGRTMLGSGDRVRKDDLRIEAYGTVDELGSCVGLALAASLDPELDGILRGVQNELFHLGADLCYPEAAKVRVELPRLGENHVVALEKHMDRFSESLEPLENFILPGGGEGAARLHVARAVCRRAERRCVALAQREEIGAFVVKYLNRLADFLFVAARYDNRRRGIVDVCWDSRA